MHVLVICKNEEDPIKNEFPRVAITFLPLQVYGDFLGQLSLQPLVRSTPNSNSVQILWLPSIPERMKKSRSKMKALEWPQDKMLILLALKGR